MKFGLEEHIIQGIMRIFEQQPKIDKAAVFGSRAKGNYKPGSDIDIALCGNELNAKDMLNLHLKWDELDLPYKLDLLDYTSIKEPALKEHIDRVGVELYSRWKNVKLQEVVSKLGDGLHGTPMYDDDGKYFFINGNNLVDGKIIIKRSTQRVSEAEYLKHKKELNDRTILLGINGTIGNIALYRGEKCILGKSACYFNVIDSVNKDFIKYVIIDKKFQSHIENFANGTTIKNVSLKAIRDFEFLLPPLPEQTAIAEVLCSLDDKIDLLHRQNKTLEQLAETLFRQWFVEEAEENWEDTTLTQHTEVFRGLSYKGSGLTEAGNGLPMHNLNSVYEFGGYKQEGIKYYNGEYRERHLLRAGDIIVTNTEQGHEYRLIGFPGIVPDYFGETGLFSQHIYRMVPLKGTYLTNQFIYYLLMTASMREQIVGATNGSTVNMLAIDGLQRPEFKLPSKRKVLQFTSIVKDYWEKKNINQNQIYILTQLRDTLLPKLMRGEVRIKM